MIAKLLPLIATLSISGLSSEIATKTEWSGAIRLTEAIRVPPGGELRVRAGARVVFGPKAFVRCDGAFSASDARFETESPLDGTPYLAFRVQPGVKVVFERCEFKGLTVGNSPPNDAAISLSKGALIVSDCVFRDCSAVETLNDAGSAFERNAILRPDNCGLAPCSSYRLTVKDNLFVAGRKTKKSLFLRSGAKFPGVTGNRFIGDGADIAIMLHNDVLDAVVSGNSFFQSAKGVYLAGKKVDNAFFFQNLFFKNAIAIDARAASGKNAVRNGVFWASPIAVSLAESPNAAMTFTHCVFAKCGTVFSGGPTPPTSRVENSCFWENGPSPLPAGDGNVFKDPGFVNPDEGNFRLKTKAFGYPEDSPLIGAAAPDGHDIGLYPIGK